MSSNVAPEKVKLIVGEVAGDSVSFVGKLDAGELLTGTPTISVSPSGLTCSSPQVSTGALTINGALVPAGKAVTFTVSGGTAGVEYTVTITAQTTNGQTRKGRVKIPMEA